MGPGYVLNEQALDQIAGQHDSDTVKVFNLIKVLQAIVEEQSGQSPYLISIGERAEQIAQAFQERQLTTQQAFEQLQQLVAEERQKTDLYWLLDRERVGQAEAVAREVMEAFKQYPHWRSSGEQERGVRIAVTKALVAAKVGRVPEHTERILQMLRRAE